MGKKKWQKNGNRTAAFVFTQDTLRLTQRAVALFEQPLQRANHLDEKVVFAKQTMQGIKQKLWLMQQSVGNLRLVIFDYNEKILIRQSMLRYTIEWLATPDGPNRERELQQCRRISMHFTDDIKRLS